MANYNVAETSLLDAVQEAGGKPVLCGDRTWFYVNTIDGRLLMDPEGTVRAADKNNYVMSRCIIEGTAATIYLDEHIAARRLSIKESFEIAGDDINRLMCGNPQPPVRPVRRSAA